MFQKSAAQGSANAQYCLGIMYEIGEGVEEDKDEAVKWYKKSAAQGFEPAKENLKKLGISEFQVNEIKNQGEAKVDKGRRGRRRNLRYPR